ncbi:MAG TPA: IclR family transcriptional regulator [Jatrophihabitantaceae bacterium]|jgi:DNA-binding IclR family transcriptional regulator|nr:IclR family transcriptional regulator [Jatrophihabitantaceae bacterium]
MAQVPAAHQTLSILRFLARQAGPVAAATIARELGLPRSTAYHLLATLQDEGFVVHLPEERRFGLGVSAYELGTGYTRHAPLQRLAQVQLAALVDRTRHGAHFAVLHGRDVLYVIEERAPGRPPLVTDAGVRLPAQLTASGRAMLAALPPQQVRALFPGPEAFVTRNDRGPRSPSALRQVLAEVRRLGFAVEDGEISPGFGSVGAAVLDHNGHPLASVAVTYPDVEVSPQRRTQLAMRVVDTARTLSKRISGAR